MRVNVTFDDGRVTTIDADPCGDGDAGEVVAVSGTVALDSRGLTFTPCVLPYKGGGWRSPSAIAAEWSANEPDYTVVGGERVDYLDATRGVRHVEREEYPHSHYILLTAEQLVGANSVTVDGVLAFAAQDGTLAPVAFDGGRDLDDDGMAQHFGKDSRPADYGMAQEPPPVQQQGSYGFGGCRQI